MAVVKALTSVPGGFKQISATDQPQFDLGAATVTETGGTLKGLPDAIAAKITGDAQGRLPSSKAAFAVRNIAYNADGSLGLTSNQFFPPGGVVTATAQDTQAPTGFKRAYISIVSGSAAANSVFIIDSAVPNSTGGFDKHPAEAGSTYEFSCSSAGNFNADLQLIFLNAAGNPTATFRGSPVGFAFSIGGEVDTYNRAWVIGTAPEGTVSVILRANGSFPDVRGPGSVFGISAIMYAKCAPGQTEPSRYVEPKNALAYTPARNLTSTVAILQRLTDRPDARDWNKGGKLDLTGANAETAKVQAMAVASGAEGVEINIPCGIINLDATIDMALAPQFRGERVFRQEFAAHNPGVAGATGSQFLIAHSGVGFQIRGRSGARLERFGTRRIQPLPSGQNQTNWSPNMSHDFDIRVGDGNGGTDHELRNIHLMNPTRAIEVNAAGRTIIEDVSGQPLLLGLVNTFSGDSAAIRRIKWWPHWQDNASVHNYTLNNLQAFQTFRTDGGTWDDLHAIWCRWGLVTNQNAQGGTSGINIGSLNIDHCLGGVWMRGTTGCILRVNNLLTQGLTNELSNFFGSTLTPPTPGSHHSVMDGGYNRLHVGYHNCQQAYLSTIYVGGEQNWLSVDQSSIGVWDRQGVGNTGYQLNNVNGNRITISQSEILSPAASGAATFNAGIKVGSFTTT